MDKISSELCHEKIIAENKPALAFDESCDYDTWKEKVREKLTELIGMGEMPEQKVPLNTRIEWEEEHKDFIEKRILFDSEEYATVPCHLWIPKNVKKPCPVVICLQGHSTGMHISMGRAKYEGDENSIAGGDRDFAKQIIKEGYAALVLEQRAFGERGSKWGCQRTGHTALLLGRTLLGERVWDVSCAIDMLETMEEIDSEKIGCMGNSGGGTATYYAACFDDRIKIAMPSCSVCTFDQSIAAMRHCICNYIPKMLKYFDIQDIACLIAPKKLVVVAGEEDNGFLLEGSLRAYNTVEKIYKKAGCEDNCRLVLGPEGHRFYANPSWKVFKELSGWE